MFNSLICCSWTSSSNCIKEWSFFANQYTVLKSRVLESISVSNIRSNILFNILFELFFIMFSVNTLALLSECCLILFLNEASWFVPILPAATNSKPTHSDKIRTLLPMLDFWYLTLFLAWMQVLNSSFPFLLFNHGVSP